MKNLNSVVTIVANHMIKMVLGGTSRIMKAKDLTSVIYVTIPLKGQATLELTSNPYINKFDLLKKNLLLKYFFMLQV